MSIKYRLTPLKDNISNKPKKGYYAQVVTKGTIDSHTLCKHIASGCALSLADMTAALVALSESIQNYLLDGYNVNIDGIGTFSVSAESKIVGESEEMHAQSVEVKHVNFRSSVSMKQAMKQAKFKREVEAKG